MNEVWQTTLEYLPTLCTAFVGVFMSALVKHWTKKSNDEATKETTRLRKSLRVTTELTNQIQEDNLSLRRKLGESVELNAANIKKLQDELEELRAQKELVEEQNKKLVDVIDNLNTIKAQNEAILTKED